MIKGKLLSLMALPAALMLSPAQAVTLGGYNVDAFASTMTVGTAGTFNTNSASLLNAVTGGSADSYAWAATNGAALGLGFAPGTLVNNFGADLVLFEIGSTSDPFTVTIGSAPAQTLTATDTGATNSAGLRLNAVAVDLSSFGIAPGAEISSILVGLPLDGADFAAAGALTAIPVPAALWMFGTGLIGLVGIARRRRH